MKKSLIYSAMVFAIPCMLLFSCKKVSNTEQVTPDSGFSNSLGNITSVNATNTNPGNIYDVEEVKGAGTAASIYVATNGNDAATGTIDAPHKFSFLACIPPIHQEALGVLKILTIPSIYPAY